MKILQQIYDEVCASKTCEECVQLSHGCFECAKETFREWLQQKQVDPMDLAIEFRRELLAELET